MITRLRSRPRFDHLRSEKRRRRSGVGRWIYLGLLAALAIWLFDMVFGDMLFLRADGFVLRERQVSAAPVAAKVTAVHVEKGQQIQAGLRLLNLHSPEFARDVAQLSVRVADLELRLAELQSKAEVLAEILPFARRRASKAREVIVIFESATGRQHVTAQRMAAALKDEVEAVEEMRRVASEHASITSRVAKLEGALERARQALDTTKALYADGQIEAHEGGTVIEVHASVGQIVRAGEPIVEVLSGPSYVLAYMSPGGLFEVEQGDEVVIRYGVRTLNGVVTERLPVAGDLPPEFQRAFRPKERAQMFRVAITQSIEPPPLMTKVQILSPDSVRALLIGGLGKLRHSGEYLQAGREHLSRVWTRMRSWAGGLPEGVAAGASAPGVPAAEKPTLPGTS